MKRNMQFLESKEEISNIPIGAKVKDKDAASSARSQISNYNSPEDIVIDAIKNNDLNLLQFIFENTKVDETIEDSEGRHLLNIAAVSGGVEVVEYIIDNKNINPNIKASSGYSILHSAFKCEKWEIIKILLEHPKIDRNIGDTFGHIILHSAAECKKWEIVKILLEKFKIDPNIVEQVGNSILRYAAKCENWENAKIALENFKIYPNVVEQFDNSLLRYAVQYGNLEIIEFLFKNYKIDPNIKASSGYSILDHAVTHEKWEIVKILLEHPKIDPNIQCPDGYSILVHAFQYGNSEIVKILLEHPKIDYLLKLEVAKNYTLNPEIAELLIKKASIINNTLEIIEFLDNENQDSQIDFSKKEIDEDLLFKILAERSFTQEFLQKTLNTLEKYVFIPQLEQKTIGELKEMFKDANLPETLIKAFSDILNEWAKEILYQERDLMSEDYELAYEYADLPLLIQHFNPEDGDDLVGLKKWFKNFPNLNKQLDNFITSLKELQNFVEFPDKKEETEAKIKQLIEKLKTKLIEQVYNDVAGVYLNKLAKLPDDEILMKCIINEHFAAALKSIKPLFLNTETQDKFSDIIEEYEVEKDKLEINFQDLIITEESGPNDEVTNPEDKTPMGDYEPDSSFFE